MGKKAIAHKVMQHRKEKSQKMKGSKNLASNPFEIKVNRDKSDVLGRKTKFEQGRPGISRSKAVKKRQRTLLQEYKVKDKANVFIDKRFGEFNEDMPIEEKMLKRFALSRQTHHKKAGTYNLDDEDLTHLGQSLATMENLDDTEMFENSDEEQGDNEVSTHFGNIPGKARRNQEEEEKPKTRKQIVEEIIAQSKKTKYERQQANEDRIKSTDDLDSEFKQIVELLGKKGGSEDIPAMKTNEYDVLVNKMKFDSKAKPSDRLKPKAEIEEEKKRKLQELEEERVKRMRMTFQGERKIESADSLGTQTKTKKDKRFEIRFKDGKMVMPEGVTSLLEERKNVVEYSEDEDDLQDQESSSEDNKLRGSSVASTGLTKVPVSAEELRNAVQSLSHQEKIKKINDTIKMLKAKDPSADCKEKMQAFFSSILDYINSLCDAPKIPFDFIDKIAGPLFELATAVPRHAQSCIQTKLRKLIKQFGRKSQLSDFKVLLPSVKEILLLKIIATLYPTSDLKHVITTPALTLMAAILNRSGFKTLKDAAIGLFLSTLILDYVTLAKRYVPEVIYFLTGILWLAVKKIPTDAGPPIKCKKSEQDMLLLKTKCDSNTISLSEAAFGKEDIPAESMRVCCTRTCLKLLTRFSKLYGELPSHSEIFAPCREYLNRIDTSLYPGDVQTLFETTLSELKRTISRERTPLTWHARKPIPLPLLEPRFMETYEIRNDKKGGRGKSNEKQKLRYKYKKEFKGAVRELRKDSQFLAREKLQETIDRDKERARKVNELMRDLGTQQGECKALEKMKKKASR